MATFEQAAEDLAKKIATFEDILEESDHRFDALNKELGTLEEGINHDFTALIEQAQTFFSKVQEEREALGREVNETGQKISEAEGQVAQSRAQTEGELGQARAHVDGLTDNLHALSPQVETAVAQGAETPAQAIGQMADQIQTSMTQALHGTRDSLQGEVTDELDQVHKNVDEGVTHLEQAAHDAGERLDRAYADFNSRLHEATDLVAQQAFDAAGTHAKDVVHYAIEECAKAHEEEIRTVGDLATQLATLLEGLKTELETAGNQVKHEGEEPLSTDMGELTAAVNTAQTALDGVKALLASYTFVSM